MQDATDIDQLSINTIRTLAADAVQKAKSGHPGTPMACAPVAYTLVAALSCAYDPAGPDLAEPRPLRAVRRPCLDAALLAAPPRRRQAAAPSLRAAPSAGGHARRHQAVPPARQQLPGPSRIPPDLGRRDDDRAAGPGLSPTASAWRSPSAGWPRTSTGRASRPVRLQRLRAVRRRRHDGGHLAARRPRSPGT